MKVQELIDELNKYPPDTLVAVPGYEHGVDVVDSVELVEVWEDKQPPEWWRGEYKINSYGKKDVNFKFNAVYIKSNRHGE